MRSAITAALRSGVQSQKSAPGFGAAITVLVHASQILRRLTAVEIGAYIARHAGDRGKTGEIHFLQLPFDGEAKGVAFFYHLVDVFRIGDTAAHQSKGLAHQRELQAVK